MAELYASHSVHVGERFARKSDWRAVGRNAAFAHPGMVRDLISPRPLKKSKPSRKASKTYSANLSGEKACVRRRVGLASGMSTVAGSRLGRCRRFGGGCIAMRNRPVMQAVLLQAERTVAVAPVVCKPPPPPRKTGRGSRRSLISGGNAATHFPSPLAVLAALGAAPAAAQTITISATGNCAGTPANCGAGGNRNGDRDTAWPGRQVGEGDIVAFTVRLNNPIGISAPIGGCGLRPWRPPSTACLPVPTRLGVPPPRAHHHKGDNKQLGRQSA